MKKEIELKYFLSSFNDLKLLFNFLKPLSVHEIKHVRQKNMYFDDNKFSLRKNHIALRLRKEKNIFWLCAKQNIKNNINNLSVRIELEFSIDKTYAYLIENNYLSALDALIYLPLVTDKDHITRTTLINNIKAIDIGGIYCIGSFVNFRHTIPIKIDKYYISIELDHSYFPKKQQFFEIEIEVKSINQARKIKSLIEDLLIKNNIDIKKAGAKSSRLYDGLKRKL